MQIIRESRLLLCVGVCFACAYFLPSASTRERYRQYRHNQELRHEIERLRLEAEIECSKSRKKLDTVDPAVQRDAHFLSFCGPV